MFPHGQTPAEGILQIVWTQAHLLFADYNIRKAKRKATGTACRERSEKTADVDGQFFFQIDEPLGDVFGNLVGGFIFVQVFVQRLDAHIAAIGHEIGNGFVAVIHGKFHAGFHPRHAFSHEFGIFFVSPMPV